MLNGRFQLTPMAWGAPQDRMRERSELGASSGHLDPETDGSSVVGYRGFCVQCKPHAQERRTHTTAPGPDRSETVHIVERAKFRAVDITPASFSLLRSVSHRPRCARGVSAPGLVPSDG